MAHWSHVGYILDMNNWATRAIRWVFVGKVKLLLGHLWQIFYTIVSVQSTNVLKWKPYIQLDIRKWLKMRRLASQTPCRCFIYADFKNYLKLCYCVNLDTIIHQFWYVLNSCTAVVFIRRALEIFICTIFKVIEKKCHLCSVLLKCTGG